MSLRETLNEYQATMRKAKRLRQILAMRYGFTSESFETMRQAFTRRLPPRLPSRPPTINGRPALRGEIF